MFCPLVRDEEGGLCSSVPGSCSSGMPVLPGDVLFVVAVRLLLPQRYSLITFPEYLSVLQQVAAKFI